MQVVVLVPYIRHDGIRCRVGDVINVNESIGHGLVERGEAKHHVQEPGFDILGKQPLIADKPEQETESEDESELTPAQKAARTRARNAALKAAEEADS